MFFKRLLEYGMLWVLGGTFYYTFELVFRGFSHPSMFVLGGICMMFFTLQGRAAHWSEPLWKQVIRCTVFVLSGEFITGLIVNKWLNLKVWDYSEQPFQLFGQICLPFALLFSVLCTFGILFCGYFLHWFFGEEKPHYRVF